MIRICAWCKKKLGEKEPLEDTSETHTICEICQNKLETKLVEDLMESKGNPRRCLTLEGGIPDDACEDIIEAFGRKRRRRRKKARRKKR